MKKNGYRRQTRSATCIRDEGNSGQGQNSLFGLGSSAFVVAAIGDFKQAEHNQEVNMWKDYCDLIKNQPFSNELYLLDRQQRCALGWKDTSKRATKQRNMRIYLVLRKLPIWTKIPKRKERKTAYSRKSHEV
ncbi:uncharacterized protein MELLADRAFT_114472 [Melampsora larici-populina 98AG31]|uniref:Uncharacterized protein n=1 Tax=Melampsora larici-populina (strain 98AG31 / pathotype 3-4-7) TaxID=747676 RepID=F4SDL4_MELLP|nr:uncharacterized protein MELLADRAFT_114472 [Melampsora larici-populina 98AG31]EGF97262.1 hypothetical protein MELLADRAFT_114472 [Melampsora larici-populina 98AG31]